MNRREREKQFGDLTYDVWRSGGNPDLVNRDNFEGYDSVHDTAVLRAELRRQQEKNRRPQVVEVRRCRVCGCTDDDCHQCIEKTGEPCHWVELDLCSACSEDT